MFSPLARGKAGWDGDLQCEEYSHQKVRHKLLFSFWARVMHDDLFDARAVRTLVRTFQTCSLELLQTRTYKRRSCLVY